MQSLWRTGRTQQMRDAEDDEALQDAIDSLDKRTTYGTDAPDGQTPGDIYFQKGATTSDPVIVYIRDKSTGAWWGGA